MDVVQARNLASAFRLASARCREARPLPNGQAEMLMAPAVVCAAFSIELGLKTLLLKAGDPQKGHDLEKLFLRLEKGVQDAIVARTSFPPEGFAKRLTVAAQTFDEWRYLYEKDGVAASLTFLDSFMSAVHAEVAARVK